VANDTFRETMDLVKTTAREALEALKKCCPLRGKTVHVSLGNSS